VGIQLARKLTYSLYQDDLSSLSAAQRLTRRVKLTTPQWCSIRPMVVIAVMTKENFTSLLTIFSRRCAWSLCRIWYIHPGWWRKLIISWLYYNPPPHLARCDAAVNVIHKPEFARFQTNTGARNNLLKHHRDSSEYMFTNHFSMMVNTHRKHVKCCIWKKKLFHENQLEAHYQQYHPMLMNEVQLPDGILPPVGWDRPEQSWFYLSMCAWMTIDELVN